MYKIILPLLLVFSSVYAQAQTLHKSHAIAMHGEPALTKDFAHLRYANPKAVKGGDLRLAYQGTFDSLNPDRKSTRLNSSHVRISYAVFCLKKKKKNKKQY